MIGRTSDWKNELKWERQEQVSCCSYWGNGYQRLGTYTFPPSSFVLIVTIVEPSVTSEMTRENA